MGQGVANLGAAQLILNINETGVSATGNYSSVAWSFYMNCGNGSSWNSDPTSWSANISGVGYSGTYTFDFRSTNSKLIAATSLNVGHAANGTLNSSGSASTGYTGTSAIGGPGSVGASYSGSNIAPQPPTSVRIGTRTNTSLQLLFNGPGSGSSPARYIYQWANNSGFSGATQGPATGSGDNTISGLQPGTNYWVRVLSQNDSGNSGWVTVATSTTVGVPGAPTGVTPSNITPTEMDVAWAAPSNVGGPNGGLTGWQLDYSLDSSFATGVTTITDGGAWGTTTHLSGLLPGNTYYVRVRAESSAGYGANSATLSQTTLPSTPPTIAVAPNVSGKGAVVTLTPPSGVTGVSSWVIKVTDTVTGTTTEYDPTSSPYTVNGLTPGRLYSYIAAAVIGAYTSPFSAPVTATQPSPSTAPGSYWDGAKADTADQDYGWAGSADVSVSTAKGKGVLGWLAAPVSTGSVVLARSTGAPAAAAPQPYGATMTVLADLAATVPSARIGMQGAAPYWSAVQPDTPYNGSIHVNPAKDLTLAAELSWYTAAGALISRSAGGAVRVLDTDDWVRVDVTAKSPSNAAFATVAAVDATTGNVYSWSGTADASPSVKKLWGSASGRTNYCRNPRVKTVTGYQGPNTTGLGIFTDAVTPCFYSQTTTSTTPYVFSAPSDVAAKAGETWVLSAVVEILGDAGANPYSFRAHANTGNVYFANGAQTLYTLTGVLTQRRVTVVCTLNADVAAGDLNFSVVRTGAASGVIIRIGQVIIEKANAFTDYFDGSMAPDGTWNQLLGGDQISVDAAMIMLNGIQPYFDGETADTPYAQYDWLGTKNQSTSTWTSLTPVGVDPLADPDVDPVPPAPQPPDIPNEGLIEVATWRRYWAAIPADQIAAKLAEVPTLTLSTGAVAERQVRIRVYENPNGLTPDVFDSSSWVSEQIVSYIPPNTQMLIDGVAERVWASVAGGDSTAADHLLYGTGGVPATWPVLGCGIAYLMSFDTPLESPSNNLTVDVSLTRRM